jgi:hypothetical protein
MIEEMLDLNYLLYPNMRRGQKEKGRKRRKDKKTIGTVETRSLPFYQVYLTVYFYDQFHKVQQMDKLS